jgi:hypothetical protein
MPMLLCLSVSPSHIGLLIISNNPADYNQTWCCANNKLVAFVIETNEEPLYLHT